MTSVDVGLNSAEEYNTVKSLTCPKCRTDLHVPDEAVGRRVRCMRCGTILSATAEIGYSAVPAPAGMQVTRPVANQADEVFGGGSKAPATSTPRPRLGPPEASAPVQTLIQPLSRQFVSVGVAVVLAFTLSIATYLLGRNSSTPRVPSPSSLPASEELVRAEASRKSSVAEQDAASEQTQPSASRSSGNGKPETDSDGKALPRSSRGPHTTPEKGEVRETVGGDGDPLKPEQLFDRVAPAVVQIEIRGRDSAPIGSGSGFLVDNSGTVITNAHVALSDGATFVVVRLFDETAFFVDDVYAVNRDMDLVVLKVKARDTAFVRMSVTPPKVGMRVFAVGNPLGLRHTFSEGLVSGIRGADEDDAIIQTTAAISPGSSGGPLLDDRANVVGVTTLNLTGGQSLNFAVPASAVRELVRNAEKPQKIALLTGSGAGSSRPDAKSIAVGQGDTLVGLKGVKVVVEGLHADAKVAGLRESTLKSMVELRLRGLGVPVMSESESVSDPRSPYLYVNVATIADSDRAIYGFVVSVDLMQRVALLDQSKELEFRAVARTWEVPFQFGSVGRLRLNEAVTTSVGELVERFANEFRAANQK